jgi:hypothetical protein
MPVDIVVKRWWNNAVGHPMNTQSANKLERSEPALERKDDDTQQFARAIGWLLEHARDSQRSPLPRQGWQSSVWSNYVGLFDVMHNEPRFSFCSAPKDASNEATERFRECVVTLSRLNERGLISEAAFKALLSSSIEAYVERIVSGRLHNALVHQFPWDKLLQEK